MEGNGSTTLRTDEDGSLWRLVWPAHVPLLGGRGRGGQSSGRNKQDFRHRRHLCFLKHAQTLLLDVTKGPDGEISSRLKREGVDEASLSTQDFPVVFVLFFLGWRVPDGKMLFGLIPFISLLNPASQLE